MSVSTVVDAVLGRDPAGYVSLRDLATILGVQGMSLDELARQAASVADDLYEDARDEMERGETKLKAAQNAYNAARNEANTIIEDGRVKARTVIATRAALKRLAPNGTKN